MTDKKRNTTGPLDEYTASARIARLLSQSAADLVDVEKTVRAAVAKRRGEIQEQIGKLMGRVPEDKRDRIAKLVLAGGAELCGFELQPSNDPAPPADEPTAAVEPETTTRDTDWLKEPVKPLEGVEVVEGKGRRVGAGQT
jgi:hypothetical protein